LSACCCKLDNVDMIVVVNLGFQIQSSNMVTPEAWDAAKPCCPNPPTPPEEDVGAAAADEDDRYPKLNPFPNGDAAGPELPPWDAEEEDWPNPNDPNVDATPEAEEAVGHGEEEEEGALAWPKAPAAEVCPKPGKSWLLDPDWLRAGNADWDDEEEPNGFAPVPCMHICLRRVPIKQRKRV